MIRFTKKNKKEINEKEILPLISLDLKPILKRYNFELQEILFIKEDPRKIRLKIIENK